MERPFVLVGGACLGGWAWSEVAPRLRELGHAVFPVTLTGLGERVHLASPQVDLETHVVDVVNVLDFEALEDAVLVGHSYSGSVVTGVADRRPQRLHAVTYLDCSPLPSGTAIADLAPPELRERQQRDVDRDGDGWRWPVPDRATLEQGLFGSTRGMEDRHFELLQQRGTPQPWATFTTPLRLVHERPPGVRRVVVLCADGGLSVAAVRQLIEHGDPRAAVFADPDWVFHELPTGHWPMFSLPGPLAALLHEIAA